MLTRFLNFFRRRPSGWHPSLSLPVSSAPKPDGTRASQPVSVPAATEIFTPTSPRNGRRGLVGRQVEIARIVDALTDEAAHVVIYAERGRGKTSLSNLVVERLRRNGTTVGRYVCDASSTFDQIITGLLRDLPPSLLSLEADTPAAGSAVGCDALLPHASLLPTDIASIPARLAANRLVFVVDEFDRVRDQGTRIRLADTIKLLSDRGLKLRFMILGVSSTLEDIIGQHLSIQRNIATVHLPLLDRDEIETVVLAGGEAAGVTFTREACDVITSVACGMPYMAQLMGLRIVQHSLRRGGRETSSEDIVVAVDRLLSDVAPETSVRYAALTSGPQGEAMCAALHSIAASTHDRWGRVSAKGIEGDQLAVLLECKVLEPSKGLPGSMELSDRPLFNYILLLAAKAMLESPPGPIRQMAAVGSHGKGNPYGH